MEEKKPIETVMPPRRLKLRERTLAYVVEHQNHSIIIPIVLAVLLLGALIFLGASEKKADAGYRADVTAHANADDDKIKLSIAGDIVLGRNVAVRAEKIGYDTLFVNMQELWADSDAVIANLDTCVVEGDLTEYEKLSDKKSYFHTDKENLAALKAAGIDILSIATDHIADYGTPSIKTAIDKLDELGIAHVGAGEDRETASEYYLIKIKNQNGDTIRIAVFGALGHQAEDFGARAKRVTIPDYLTYDDVTGDYEYTDETTDTTESEEVYDPWVTTAGTFSGRNQNFTENINNARAKADVIIVYMHWGDDKMFVESDDMRELAHSYIDAGADIVIGTNPRVILPAETYKSRVKTGYIFYSIGSLVYDDAESRVCDSILLDVIIDNDMNKSIEITPLRINACIPGETHSAFYTKRIFASLTKNLDESVYHYEGNKLIIPMN